MSEIKKILKRIKLDNLVSYLIYGKDFAKESNENFDEKLYDSFEEIFSRLEKLYPEANRQDNSLFEAVTDFSLIHDELYFEAGLLAGFQLYKSLDQGFNQNFHEKVDGKSRSEEDTVSE